MRFCPESRTVSANSRCSSSNGVFNRSSVMPRMPFMGVLISWLMLARNSLLARLALSASSLVTLNSLSYCLRPVMSDMEPIMRVGLPPASRTT
jgi:hypothetical protein